MRESQKSVTQELLISDMFFVQSFCEALGQASFGIIIADKKDVICFLNSKAGHFLGIQPSHFIGKRIHEILPDSADAPSLRNFSAYGVKQVFINERQLVCNTIPIKMGDTSMATVKILINFSDLTNLKNELKENT
jgi:sensor histidine kinase regulating citrate/malate metabolism